MPIISGLGLAFFVFLLFEWFVFNRKKYSIKNVKLSEVGFLVILLFVASGNFWL